MWEIIYDFLFTFNGNHGAIWKRFQVTALRNMRDLDFDLSRSLQVKANAAIWKSIHDFLFNFNGNYGPICKRFQVTALWNMLEMCLTSIWPLKVTLGQNQWRHLQQHVWLPIQLQ